MWGKCAERGWFLPLLWFGLLLTVALLTRFAGLDLALTTDEGHWLQRTVRFGAALERGDLASTYRSGHPGVTLTWIGLLGIGPARLEPLTPTRLIDEELLQRAPGYLEALGAARAAVAAVTAVLVALSGWLAYRLFGGGAGLLGGALLVLDPYLVGSSRLLHVDALLAPLMLTSALAGLVYWIGKGGRRYLLLAAVTAGLALLTKVPAVFLLPYWGLLALAGRRPGGRREQVGAALGWALATAGVILLCWPALWVAPLGTLRNVARFVLDQGSGPHEGTNFFLGQIASDDPGVWYYPVVLAFRLGPVVLLGLLALPLGLQPRWRAELGATFWALVYAIFFLEMMTLGAKKFDRYALPAIAMLDLLGGVGLWLLIDRLGPARWRLAGLLAPLLVQAALLGQAYPYPLAAYNPLLGGGAGASRALLVGWGEGLDQAAAYLNAQPNAESLTASTAYASVLRPLFRGSTLFLVDQGQGAVDYFVLYKSVAQRDLIPTAVRRTLEQGQPVFTAYVQGVPYAWVYRLAPAAPRPPGQVPTP